MQKDTPVPALHKVRLNKNYPWEVWGATIIAAPLFISFFLLSGTTSDEVFTLFYFFIYLLTTGAFFLIPAIILYWLAFRKLGKKQWTPIKLKLVLWAVAQAFMLITFLVVTWDSLSPFELDTLMYPMAYSLTLLACSLVFSTSSKGNRKAAKGNDKPIINS